MNIVVKGLLLKIEARGLLMKGGRKKGGKIPAASQTSREKPHFHIGKLTQVSATGKAERENGLKQNKKVGEGHVIHHKTREKYVAGG